MNLCIFKCGVGVKLRKYYESDDSVPQEEKYLYLLLFAPGYTCKFNEPIKGTTWLHKHIHVLSKAIPESGFEFEKHNFGIYSPSLEIILNQNITSDYICQTRTERAFDKRPIELTKDGIRIARTFWKELNPNEQEIISKLKSFLNEMNYWELIGFSYSTFPETTDHSQIMSKFREKRLPVAVSLFVKQKISLKKAASMSGMSVDLMEKELIKRKIHPYELNAERYNESLKLIENIT